MGASCDWNRSVFTLDDTPRRAVRKTFVDLFNDGRIYRGARIINWDPQMMTALSDVEVEYQESEGHLWHVRYPFVDEQGNELVGEAADGVTIATTRPETIPADVAIAVHPDDERWQPHHGRLVRLPLRGFERLLPIVADAAVDPEFGTGALKITPGHDQLDFEIGERHGLEPLRAVDWDGSITAEGGIYVGMDRDEARERIVEHLAEDGYLVRTEAHRHNVGHSQRSGVAVEPLVSNQWFVDTTEAGGGGGAGGARGRGADRARALDLRLFAVDGEHPPVVHLAAVVVGAPHPGLVLPRVRRGGDHPSRRRGDHDR